MMNFEEISKKVRKFSKDTMTEVQKMNEVRQLNGKVSEEKKYLNKLYLEMGKKLYDKYKDAETAPEGFETEFRKIRERYSVMDLLQDEIRKVKGVVLCPCCNMEVAATERFCSNCGNRMPEPVKIEGKEEAEVIDSADDETKEADAEAAETVVDVEAEEVSEADTAETEDDARAAEEEATEAESDAETAGEDAADADVTEEVVEESDAAQPDAEVTEEVSGEDAGEAAEEVLEEAKETSEKIPAEGEAAAEASEEPGEDVPADKTEEVAAEADEAAAAKAAEPKGEE